MGRKVIARRSASRMIEALICLVFGMVLTSGAEIAAQTTRPDIAPNDATEYVLLFKPGARWMYKVNWELEQNLLLWKKVQRETGTLTITNEGETKFADTRVIRLSWTFAGTIAYQMNLYLTASPDGILLIGSEIKQGATTSVERYEPPLLFMKAPVRVGTAWDYTGSRIQRDGKATAYGVKNELVQQETLMTAAGQFEAVRLAGRESNGNSSTEWWAKGVGLIRREEIASSHRSVSELVGYSLPREAQQVVERPAEPAEVPDAAPIPSPRDILRSMEGRVEAVIDFENQAREPLLIYWIDYEGKEVLYRELAPGQSYRQSTFVTHPWRIRVKTNGGAVKTVVAESTPQRVVIEAVELEKARTTGEAPPQQAAAPSSTAESEEGAFKIQVCDRWSRYSEVRVDVPERIDLSNDATARMILEKAARFARENCQWVKGFSNIVAFVVQPGNRHAGQCLVKSRAECVVRARNYDETKLTWGEYWNGVFQARVAQEQEEARKRAEAQRGRAKIPISRTIERFSLGMSKDEALAVLGRQWGADYLPYVPAQDDWFKVPIWFNRVKSGQIANIELSERIAGEGAYFRTTGTRYVSLYFYRGTLYQIGIGLLGEGGWGMREQDEVFQTLARKYGQPGNPRCLLCEPFWQDDQTELELGGMGLRTMSYADRRLVEQIKGDIDRMKRAEQERLQRERRTVPKGY